MTSDQSTVKMEKGTVRNWTDEEKELVWEQACQAKEENLPLTEAFRRVVKLLPHRSEAAVGMLYYNVLRKEREEPLPVAKKPHVVTTSEFKIDSRLLEAFQGLPEYMQELNTRISRLEARIDTPDPMMILKALGELGKGLGNLDNQESTLVQLQKENTILSQTNLELQKDLEKLKEAYEDALGIYDLFTNMASISQIMSLGDFKQQMKTTLDKWGNVLEVTFERKT